MQCKCVENEIKYHNIYINLLYLTFNNNLITLTIYIYIHINHTSAYYLNPSSHITILHYIFIITHSTAHAVPWSWKILRPWKMLRPWRILWPWKTLRDLEKNGVNLKKFAPFLFIFLYFYNFCIITYFFFIIISFWLLYIYKQYNIFYYVSLYIIYFIIIIFYIIIFYMNIHKQHIITHSLIISIYNV